MRIAIFADTHLGYPRFEEDSYVQAQRVIDDACLKADILLCAGDIFDTKIPKLETLKRAVDIFNRATKPVYAIFGNHERRTKDMVNPVQLLASSTRVKLLHGNDEVIENRDGRIQIVGMGSVPEEYAEAALKSTLERIDIHDGAFRILMIHQTIKELLPIQGEGISISELEQLPFDLIINGHIHEKHAKLGGRFLIPGGTVITQLKKEQAEPRGYYIYDTSIKEARFVEIQSRPLVHETIVFSDADSLGVRERVIERITAIRKEKPDSIIVLRLEGTLKEGADPYMAKSHDQDDVFIENRLDEKSLAVKMERIKGLRSENLTVRDLAIKELESKTKERITLFDPSEFFDKLVEGPEQALAYLESRNKKDASQKGNGRESSEDRGPLPSEKVAS